MLRPDMFDEYETTEGKFDFSGLKEKYNSVLLDQTELNTYEDVITHVLGDSGYQPEKLKGIGFVRQEYDRFNQKTLEIESLYLTKEEYESYNNDFFVNQAYSEMCESQYISPIALEIYTPTVILSQYSSQPEQKNNVDIKSKIKRCISKKIESAEKRGDSLIFEEWNNEPRNLFAFYVKDEY